MVDRLEKKRPTDEQNGPKGPLGLDEAPKGHHTQFMNSHDGSSVANRTYEHIRSRILSGQYPNGKQLVTRQIAKEMGASLNPVREAIGRLAAEGLLDHIPGAGAFVPAPSPEEILEVYEFRKAIEPFASEKAALLITAPELNAMHKICDEQRRIALSLRVSGGHLLGEDLEHWFQTEEHFHRTLVRAARNRYIDRAILQSRVLTQLFQGHRALGVQVNLRVASHTWLAHSRLVRALEQRDPQAAAACTLNAIERGARQVLASALPAFGSKAVPDDLA
jgi:DNA-binding GntR family transcriptional regulator